MSTSKHTFDQVKNILGKLDRAIDATRARRLDPAHAPAAAAEPRPDPRRDVAGQIGAGGGSMPGPTPDPSTIQARPLRPTDTFGNSPSAFTPRPDFRRA